jgi:hypothetical protein
VVKIFVVHGRTDILHAEIVEIHGQDLLTVLTKCIKVLVKQIGQVILKQGIIGRSGVMYFQGLVTQFLGTLQKFFPFLHPDILADGIEIGAKFAAEFQLICPDPLVYDDHCILENIPGLFPGSLVMDDIPLNDGIVVFVDMPEDKRIMIPDTFDQFTVGGESHYTAAIKKAGDAKSPA